MAALFMDDTTLLAQTRGDLQAMSEVYVGYCFKFHMNLNPTKSKLMHFTPHATRDQFTIVAGGRTFSTPVKKTGQERCRIKYLGLTVDSGLSATGHVEAKLRSAQARCAALDVIARAMGPSFALWYLRVHLAPSILYALEVVPLGRPHRERLAQLHTQLISEAVGLGALGGNPGRTNERADPLPIPCIRRDCLVAETSDLPWDVEVSRRTLRLLAGLNMAASATSQTLAKTVVSNQGGSAFVDRARRIGQSWGITRLPVATSSKTSLQAWKVLVRAGADRAVGRYLAALTTARIGETRPGYAAMDLVYAQTMPLTRDDHHKWSIQVPSLEIRDGLRQFKLGAIPQLRQRLAKRVPRFASLPPANQALCLECPCGAGGPQDTRHFILDCGFSRPARDAALGAMDGAMASALASSPSHAAAMAAWWAAMGPQDKLMWMLRSQGTRWTPGMEAHIRRPGCYAWVPAMRQARASLGPANAAFTASLLQIAP